MNRLIIQLAFGASVMVLILTSYYVYISFERFQNDAMWVAHSQRVKTEIENLTSIPKDLSIELRRAAVKGDTVNTNKLEDLIFQDFIHFNILDSLILDESEQSKNLDSLRTIIDNHWAKADSLISYMSHRYVIDDYLKALLYHEESSVDNINIWSNRMMKIEDDLLKKRTLESDQSAIRAPTTLMIMALMAVIIIAFLFVKILRDARLREKAEQNLLMAERLSMTGKIARSIAHEIRNPLTNLGLALDQLGDELPEDEDTEMFIGIIERNAKRIDQLITEMLNASKPKELVMTSNDVNTLIKEALVLVKDRLTLKGMTLVENLGNNIPNIQLDVDKMKMALLNIFVNAVEAMEEHKGQLVVSSYFKSNLVYIDIVDNGSGISPQDIDTMFDPFYTKKHGGMGLGLTSTQNIIQSHRGRIEVSSKEGYGTTFRIVLPVKK
ncbi:MAG TPA: ATP-binding protein [Fulvivirga sp.]|nr:ATP-binding protein [Fulvivirga sp.]